MEHTEHIRHGSRAEGVNGAAGGTGRVRRAALALVGAAVLAAVTVTPAQAEPGETKTLCRSEVTPSGWLEVRWGKSETCGATDIPNIKTITQVAGLPVGSRVEVCATMVPPEGWQPVSTSYSVDCRTSLGPGTYNNRWVLERVS
ncbi:hypothetical protein AB0B21_28430 [Streptomyces rimosus]|uniref:hypothetical protein n=1 Tax=Streptomyces rimosus TaxID=1927 RepID=UPI000519806B|nr:hypothetical protein [Streptomyces rimosus]